MPGKKYTRRSNIRKVVQSVINKNLETKTFQISYTSYAINDSGRSPIDTNITGIVQGDGQNERDGNQYRLKSITGKFFVTGADSTNSIRIILYKPKNVSYDLTTDGLTFNGAVDLDKYIIYKDLFVTTSTNGSNCKRISFSKAFKGAGLPVQFSGSSAASLTTGMIRFHVVSDSLAVTDPSLDGFIRVKFKDA